VCVGSERARERLNQAIALQHVGQKMAPIHPLLSYNHVIQSQLTTERATHTAHAMDHQ
jgi:hypothetical protein